MCHEDPSKNIGIIQDFAIEISGLTVITGQNNSGKTTIGKVLYSLIDSVSKLKQKSMHDRYYYAVEQLEKACACFPFHLYFEHRKEYKEYIENECLKTFFADEYRDDVSPDKIDLFLSDLIYKIKNLIYPVIRILLFWKNTSILPILERKILLKNLNPIDQKLFLSYQQRRNPFQTILNLLTM